MVKARARLGEDDAEGVAVERAQALDLACVVERRTLERRGADLLHAEHAGVLEQVQAGALQPWVIEALDRIDIVGGDELARLATKRRVIHEVDPRADAE